MAQSGYAVPLPLNDLVLLKSFGVLEAGTIAVLKRLNHKTQGFFLEVALATSSVD
jgi:hypothetical protein